MTWVLGRIAAAGNEGQSTFIGAFLLKKRGIHGWIGVVRLRRGGIEIEIEILGREEEDY